MTKISGVLFDLYGTLFDVHSVVERCDQLFPGRGIEISVVATEAARIYVGTWPDATLLSVRKTH